ncbi:hypothetical protein [Methylobacterium nodulans]|uniref:PD-(D/E)XK endonuclease-like domain-containing protein n=1 Tax=Methylobacterium nodulans (strain LMG 21967 / CNCM I-2342 / ORS 2060) TaxID=460265 RepID=B8IRR3_METNO|nr:hypothetical protein [Methylobacterium nodulans]ACL60613.1 hypothetical protein Mnod_5784 [Methylobacterium nodulans ORS 2060]
MIEAALTSYALGRAKVWDYDRSQTVGASEVGQCARKIFYMKNEEDAQYGTARDLDYHDGWGAKERGTVYEAAFWVPAIRARFGASALFTGDAQRTFADGFLSATPDGLLIDQPADALAALGVSDIEGDSILLDCKSIDPRAKLDSAKPEHLFQVQAGMGLLRRLTRYRPSYAIISYTDASFWDETKEFVVRFDEGAFRQAEARARDIMLARSADELRPEGRIAGGQDCEHCPFTGPCGQRRAERVPREKREVPADTAADLLRLGRAASEAMKRAEAAEAEAAARKEQIREILARHGTKSFKADGLSISWAALKGRPSWDDKAIREAAQAAGIDLTPFSKVGDPSDRLTISTR